MMRTYKYRLYPNKQQERTIVDTLQTCCWLYNHGLAERRDAWQGEKRSVRYVHQSANLTLLKKQDERLSQVYSQVLQNVLKRVERAFEGFFDRVKMGEKPGYPRFRSTKRYDSFTYPQHGFEIENRRLHLAKIGSIKIKLHRPLEGKIKTCTIRRYADGWYALFACEVESRVLPVTDRVVGVDLGIESFATTSDECFFPSVKAHRKAEKKLKKQQRAMDRKKPGSNRRKKAQKQLAKTSIHVANQRKDNAHKVARELVNQYQLIAVEDLNVAGMLKNHCLAKAIQDQGWGNFISILKAKAEEAGRQVVEVDPKYTSQECCECGQIKKKTLKERWHKCDCGCSLHRDVNAARNILRRAIG